MAYVQNRAADYIMSGAQSSANNIANAGAIRGQMYAKLGNQAGQTIQSYFQKKERSKLQDAAANELLGMGYSDEDARGIAKSFKEPGDFLKWKQFDSQEKANKEAAQYHKQSLANQTAQINARAKEREAKVKAAAKEREAQLRLAGNLLAQLDAQDPQVQKMTAVFKQSPVQSAGMVAEFAMGKLEEAGKPVSGYASKEEAEAVIGKGGGQVYQNTNSGRWHVNESVPREASPGATNAIDWQSVKTYEIVPRDASGKQAGLPEKRVMSLKDGVEAGLPEFAALRDEYEKQFGGVNYDNAEQVLAMYKAGKLSEEQYDAQMKQLFPSRESFNKFKSWLKI